MTEIRPIPDHPDYGASADGRVWRITPRPSGRWNNLLPVPYPLEPHLIEGYPVVSVRRDGARNPRKITVASAVALAWLGPRPLPNARVRTRNGDKSDCRVENLEWWYGV